MFQIVSRLRLWHGRLIFPLVYLLSFRIENVIYRRINLTVRFINGNLQITNKINGWEKLDLFQESIKRWISIMISFLMASYVCGIGFEFLPILRFYDQFLLTPRARRAKWSALIDRWMTINCSNDTFSSSYCCEIVTFYSNWNTWPGNIDSIKMLLFKMNYFNECSPEQIVGELCWMWAVTVTQEV